MRPRNYYQSVIMSRKKSRRDETRLKERIKIIANLNLPRALTYISAYGHGNPMAKPKAETCTLTKVHVTL